jgi:hypothetical protein
MTNTPNTETGVHLLFTKTSDALPEKPGLSSYEYVQCLIVVNGEWEIGNWNCEHLVWDDEECDDFKYEPTQPTHWAKLPLTLETDQS